MKVLLTGIDGYIGTQMAQVLLKKGHDVVGLDTGFYREGYLYNGIKKFPEIITKDTREITTEDLLGYEAVIHLAELSNDPLGKQNPEITYEINYKGSLNLAKMAKKAGVKRFLYSSSCSVYGIATTDVVGEQSIPNPQTDYAKCKVQVEKDVAELSDNTFSPVFLRNATVYGISPRMRFDLVVNNLSGFAWTTKEIKMTSDGSPWRPLIHILDVCDAFVAALEAPEEIVRGQIINVGDSSSNYQIKDVASIIKQVFPECNISLGNSDGDTRSYRVNFDKIRKLLPTFRPTRSVLTGAQELKKLFETIQFTKDQFEFRSYTRLKALEYLKESGQVDEKLYWRNI